MLCLKQQEASLFLSLLSLELREHSSLLLRWSRWSDPSFPPSPVMSHPAITVSVNRSVFTTAGQTSGWKVHVSRWTTDARLGMMAALTWCFCLVPPCRSHSPSQTLKGSFLWSGDVTLQFHVKTAVCLLVLWQSFWSEPAGPFPEFMHPSWTQATQSLLVLWCLFYFSLIFCDSCCCFWSSFFRNLLITPCSFCSQFASHPLASLSHSCSEAGLRGSASLPVSVDCRFVEIKGANSESNLSSFEQ